MRTILLKLECKGAAGGCCGKSGRKPTYKHALLRIEMIGFIYHGDKPPTPNKWSLIEASPLYGNILTMAQKHSTEKPAWRGTVANMKLDKDPDFMAQLNAMIKIKKGCVVTI